MADTKISGLPASTTPLAGTEVLPIVQSSSTVQVSVANLTAGRAVATGALTVTGAATVSGGLAVTGTLSATGNVTIAPASGAARLDLNSGGGSAIYLDDTSANGQWLLGANNYAGQFEVYNVDRTSLDFKINNATGLATFANSLAVTGTLSATGTLSGGTSGTAYSFSGSAPAGSLTLDSSGNVGIGATANASAILDAQSTTKGVRMPNMTTTQKNAISSPAAGLMVFDTTLAKLSVYSGTAWQTITSV